MLGLLLSTLCFADPQFAALEEGEPAPFTGRLLNDEAIVKISIEDQFKAQQCEIQIDYEKQKLQALHTYELEKLKIRLESDNEILKNKIELPQMPSAFFFSYFFYCSLFFGFTKIASAFLFSVCIFNLVQTVHTI